MHTSLVTAVQKCPQSTQSVFPDTDPPREILDFRDGALQWTFGERCSAVGGAGDLISRNFFH